MVTKLSSLAGDSAWMELLGSRPGCFLLCGSFSLIWQEVEEQLLDL